MPATRWLIPQTKKRLWRGSRAGVEAKSLQRWRGEFLFRFLKKYFISILFFHPWIRTRHLRKSSRESIEILCLIRNDPSLTQIYDLWLYSKAFKTSQQPPELYFCSSPLATISLKVYYPSWTQTVLYLESNFWCCCCFIFVVVVVVVKSSVFKMESWLLILFEILHYFDYHYSLLQIILKFLYP